MTKEKSLKCAKLLTKYRPNARTYLEEMTLLQLRPPCQTLHLDLIPASVMEWFTFSFLW